jgi:hypothetical protein
MTKYETGTSGSNTRDHRHETVVMIRLPYVPQAILDEEHASGVSVLTPAFFDNVIGRCLEYSKTVETNSVGDVFKTATELQKTILADPNLCLTCAEWQEVHINTCVWWALVECFDLVRYFTEQLCDWRAYSILGISRGNQSIVFVRLQSESEQYHQVRRQYLRDALCAELAEAGSLGE